MSDDSPVNTNKPWFPMVSKWCRSSSIHSRSFLHCDAIQKAEAASSEQLQSAKKFAGTTCKLMPVCLGIWDKVQWGLCGLPINWHSDGLDSMQILHQTRVIMHCVQQLFTIAVVDGFADSCGKP